MEIDTLILTIKQLQKEMSSDVGVLHLLDVQEKLQKFHLQESQVNSYSVCTRILAPIYIISYFMKWPRLLGQTVLFVLYVYLMAYVSRQHVNNR